MNCIYYVSLGRIIFIQFFFFGGGKDMLYIHYTYAIHMLYIEERGVLFNSQTFN